MPATSPKSRGKKPASAFILCSSVAHRFSPPQPHTLQCNFHGGSMAALPRRTSVPVKIGDVWVGGDHPVVVQSMTNTDTADTASTVHQVMALAQAGSELVRVTVNTEAAARPFPKSSTARQARRPRPHHRRLPLQRPRPADEVSRVRARSGQVPHQSRQRQHRRKTTINFRTMIEVAVEISASRCASA